jgi:hypothetical protein
MKSVDSFPFLIDYILEDLEKASRIEIDLHIPDPENSEKQDNGIIVISVNGQVSAQRYFHYMKDSKAVAMNKLREILPQITPTDTEIFFEQVQRRIKRILQSIIIMNENGKKASSIQDVCWSQKQIHCKCNGVDTESTLHRSQAIRQTRRNAWIFYLVVKKLEDRIHCAAGAHLFVTIPLSLIPRQETGSKFKISCTVTFLGALLRILCDRNIVENPNVADLCRRISLSLYTGRQENISPHSLRNAFDDPKPEVLMKVLEELKICEKYTEKFIDRQRL